MPSITPGKRGRPPGRRSLAVELGGAFLSRAAELAPIDDGRSWPAPRYQTDPAGFAREVFGLQLASYQVEILEAIRDNRRTAVASGRKIGKSTIAAIAALWFYCSFPESRVFITAGTAAQVTRIIWREIKRLHGLAAKRGYPIDGDPAQHAGSGLKSPDGLREIFGFANAKREDAAGISGAYLLYIFDEASGVSDEIYEAAEGNRAGGGGVVRSFLISNPTRCEGEFYQAFHEKSKFYWQRNLSSELSPNVTGELGDEIIPGLASPEWIADMKAMYGEESPFYAIHVRGVFVEGEEGRAIKLEEIIRAQDAWPEMVATGRLVVGIDPAGQGVGGDEFVFALRRGRKVLWVEGFNGLSPGAALVKLEGYLSAYLEPREIALVVLDGEGAEGARVRARFAEGAAKIDAKFRMRVVQSSHSGRRPKIYQRIRDELWAELVDWLRDGGTIPTHAKLAQDLHAVSWIGTKNNLIFVTPKSELRKTLGRSPDYGDAVCLSTWFTGEETAPPPPPAQQPKLRGQVADPFTRSGIDPYGRGNSDDD